MEEILNETQTPEVSCTFLKPALQQTTQVFIGNIVTIVVEGLIAAFATASNALIAFVILKTRSLHCTSNTLLCCLAVTDFFTGLVVAPLNIATKLAEMQLNTGLYCIVGVAGSLATWIVASVTFLTLTLISIERFLALRLHLRYKTLVTSRRILKVIAAFWVIITTLCMLRFWDVKETYVRPLVIGNIAVNLVVTIHCYRKIYETVMHHRKLIKQESSACSTLNIERTDDTAELPSKKRETVRMLRYRSSTLTMAYVVGFFLFCYSPIFVYQIVVGLWKGLDKEATRVAYRCCVTVALLKSALNPLLYCMRLNDIRMVLKKTIKGWYEVQARKFPSIFTPKFRK